MPDDDKSKLDAAVAAACLAGAVGLMKFRPDTGADPRVFAQGAIKRLKTTYKNTLKTTLPIAVLLEIVPGAMDVAVAATAENFSGPMQPGDADVYMADALQTAIKTIQE